MADPNPFIEFGNLVPDVVSNYGTNADQRVRVSRAKLYREMPNDHMETTPLTKIVMSNKGQGVGNVKFEWGMDAHDPRYALATGAYTNNTLATPVGATAQTAADATIYLKMSEVNARGFVKYEEIEMRLLATDDTHADHDAFVNGVVMDKAIAGENSYLTVKLLEKDVGGGGVNGNVLGQAFAGSAGSLYVSPLSVAMPEGSALPWGRYREPTEKYNYIQTIMAGLGLTGEELSNAQRFDETTYQRYWRQTHEKFNSYIERAILFGTRQGVSVDVDMGAGLQTLSQYRTGGLRWMFKHEDFGGGKNIFDIRKTTTFMDTNFAGKTWEEGGYEYIKQLLLYLSLKSGSRKKMYCSAQRQQDIMNLFESMTQVTVQPFVKDKWGFTVTKIHGLTCTLEIAAHADLSINPAWQRTAFIIEPEKLDSVSKKGRDMSVIKSVTDLKDKTKVQDGFGWRDATKEGIFTTFGLRVDDLDGMCILNGIGCNFAD